MTRVHQLTAAYAVFAKFPLHSVCCRQLENNFTGGAYRGPVQGSKQMTPLGGDTLSPSICHIDLYAYIYIYIHDVCVFVFVFVSSGIYICTGYVQVHVYVCVILCVYMYMYAYICMHVMQRSVMQCSVM